MEIWPVHLQPLNDELLSSWMIRLAHGNGYKAHDFYAHYFGRETQIWNRDIDCQTPDLIINRLHYFTKQNVDNIRHLSMKSYENILFEHSNSAVLKGVLSIGIKHRLRKRYGLQICPMCLKEDKVPYYRKYWRVSYLISCPTHGIQLYDRCYKCSFPITPHRVDMIEKSKLATNLDINFCSNCFTKLSNAPMIKVNENLKIMSKFILSALYKEHVFINSDPIFANLFFLGLRGIIQGYIRNLGNEISSQTNSRAIELLEFSDRSKVLNGCANLLVNWPKNFLDYTYQYKHPYTNFISKNSSNGTPFWLYKVFR
ncbi:TniQ family protein [Acinetobacter nectaris]|uniref:TniQ family protein n=1 Tax=Acinetobacter nectaris TaxID=1219382 RepID=UPI001F302A6D|nr:TniQ family protein [Acinetobacter nectaris]MCF9045732.1 TniQ family protein [Acinetobacter nectaris]